MMYRLIMIDFKMPNTNGLEASRYIHHYLADEQKIPNKFMPYIVCISNYCNYEAVQKNYKSVGIDELIQKPIFKLGIYDLLYRTKLID